MKVKEDIVDSGVIEIKKYFKSKNPKVTVIVPVFKVERYLAQCLNSIINQTMEDIEIIIVDEGLQDRCREIIDYYESIDPRIIAPHYKNGGYGASCNLGIQMSKGEYLIIVESDDFVDPEMCEEMYAYAKSLNADVVKVPYKEYYSNGEFHDCVYRNYMRERTPLKACFSVKEFGDLLSVHASLWAAIYNTEYMKDNNIQFVTAKGGAYVDVGFRIDTLINTNKIAWLDKPYYNYRVDSEGSTTNNFNLDKMIQRWKEVHEKFSRNQDDYDEFYGKYLIFDEYLNTFAYLKNISFSKKQYIDMYNNLKYIKGDIIKESPLLTNQQKKELMMYKENNRKYLFFLKNYRIYLKIKEKVFNLILRIGKVRNLFILFVFYIFVLSLYILNPFFSFYKILLLISTLLITLYFIDVFLYIILKMLIFIKKSIIKSF